MSQIERQSQFDAQKFDDDGTADVMPGSAARPTAAEPIQAIMQKAVSRRVLLKGAAAASATLVIAPGAVL
jgi:hypothetical protein